MDFTRSFSFPFKDQNWIQKLLIGGVIALVPVLNFALFGWMVEIVRRVMRNDLDELPGWDDLGKKFTDGLYYFGASFVYALPIVLLACVLAVSSGGLAALMENGSAEDIANIAAAGSGVLALCLSCGMMIYGLVLSVVMPGLMVHFAQDGNFGAFFKFGEVFAKVREFSGPFFTAWIVSIVAGFAVGIVVGLIGGLLGWIPCIGQIIVLLITIAVTPYTSAIYAHLFGQYGAAAYGTAQMPPVM